MSELQLVHTAYLDVSELRQIRELLDIGFEGRLDEQDFEHALGGMHALLRQHGELIAHGSVVQRRLLHQGRALRTGYVEAVAVRPELRGLGHGSSVLTALETVIRGGYEIGALGASDQAVELYVRRGWRLWRGTVSAMTPRGIERTPDEDGGIYVLPVTAELSWDGDLACDWRDGDVW
jgi:aminoglycoside 2'-N-acetyltransferase I